MISKLDVILSVHDAIKDCDDASRFHILTSVIDSLRGKDDVAEEAEYSKTLEYLTIALIDSPACDSMLLHILDEAIMIAHDHMIASMEEKELWEELDLDGKSDYERMWLQ